MPARIKAAVAGPETERAVAKFLAYFEEIKRLYQQATGHPLEMYKDTKPGCLAEAFEFILALSLRGVEFVTETVHRLAWSQCLGNGNHRTTALFVGDFIDSLGLEFPPHVVCARQFCTLSEDFRFAFSVTSL